MLQLWKLVLLCGLLTGTSASLLHLGDDLHGVVDKLTPVLDKGLETVDHALDSLLQKVKVDLKVLQNSSAWKLAVNKIQEAQKLIDNVFSDSLPSLEKSLGLKTKNFLILDIKPQVTADGNKFALRIPVIANLTLDLPILGQIIDLQVSLDFLTGVTVEIDPQTKVPRLILGECAVDPNSISFSLMDRRSKLINNVVDAITGTLNNAVPYIMQKDVCPLIHILLRDLNVDVKYIHDLMGKDAVDKYSFP
uniref:BPI fold containing family A member 2 n=1 Tax=Otolemur garnettii TaxID=30611 RepID=H0X3C5_OTOGA